MRNNLTKLFKVTFITILSLFIACDKKELDNSKNTLEIPEGYVSVALNPQLEEIQEDNFIDKQASTNFSSFENDEILDYSPIKELGEVDFRGAVKSSNKSSSYKKKIAAINTPILRMTSGTKYMVLIYDENDNYLPEFSKQLTAGGTSSTANNTIVLKARTRYKYVAFSYNSNDDITSYTINPSTQQVQTGNYEFMYTKGTIEPLNYQPVNPNNNPNRLNLIFERKLSKIKVTYDIRGLHTFAAGATPTPQQITLQIVKSSSNQNNPFSKGIFDLKSGNFLSHTNYTNGVDFNPTWVSAIGLGNTFNDYSTTTVYTSQPTSLDKISLKFTRLNYYVASDRLITTNVSASNPLILTIEKPITIDEGIGNNVVFELIQPAVTLPTNSNITTKWAIANTVHRGWGTHNPFIMRSTGNGNSSSIYNDINHNDRFRFNDLLPEVYANYFYTYLSGTLYKRPTVRGQLDSMGDPCKEIRPLGLWKTPSSAQLEELANYINNNYTTSWNNSGSGAAQRYMILPSGPTRSTLVSYINHNRLIINRLGYGSYNTGTNSYNHLGYNNVSGGTCDAYYWSSEGRKYLKISNTSATSIKAEILTSNNINTTMSIRCVRAD